MRYLGPEANRFTAYGVASVSGAILAVCSCTVLPIFKGIYKKGAGLGAGRGLPLLGAGDQRPRHRPLGQGLRLEAGPGEDRRRPSSFPSSSACSWPSSSARRTGCAPPTRECSPRPPTGPRAAWDR